MNTKLLVAWRDFCKKHCGKKSLTHTFVIVIIHQLTALDKRELSQSFNENFSSPAKVGSLMKTRLKLFFTTNSRSTNLRYKPAVSSCYKRIIPVLYQRGHHSSACQICPLTRQIQKEWRFIFGLNRSVLYDKSLLAPGSSAGQKRLILSSSQQKGAVEPMFTLSKITNVS